MATYLDRIVAVHRAAARADPRPLDELLELTLDTPTPRGFRDALAAADGLAVIAEVKRRSPSKGDLAPNVVPAELAAAYERGGATCISVLTDAEFFGGSPADLGRARGACSLPVLRKDFTVSAQDVCDARLMGADAVLLIVAALDDAELRDFAVIAAELALDTLMEVHDGAELERAVLAGASMLGVNQRDLVTFDVDRERGVRLASLIPEGIVRIAESGIGGPADARRLADAGYDAVLVGEAFVTAPDPAGAVAAMREAGR